MSFTQGFATGYGLVDNTLARQRAEERQAAMDDRNETRYQEGLALQKAQAENAEQWKQKDFDASQRAEERQAAMDDRNEKRYQEGLALQKAQAENANEWKQKNFDASQNWKAQDVALTQQRNNLAQENSDRSYGLQKKQLSLSEQKAKRDIELNKLQTMNERNKLAGQYFQQYLQSGQVDEKGAAMLGDSVYSGTYKAVSAIKNDFISVLNNYDSIQTPDQLIQFANSPKTLSVVNASMRNELYSRDKATGNKHEIVALEPAQGGVIPILKITDKDGNVITQKAPATKNRSSGKEDQIMVVPIKDMKQKIVETFRFADYADSDPILKSLLSKSTGEYAISDGYMYNKKTGEGKQVTTRKNELTQKDIDQGYMKYINALSQSGLGETPMSKQSWIKQQGLGSDTAPQINQEKINAYLRGRNQQ